MLSPLSKPLFWRVAVLVWGGVLYWLSAQPGTALPVGFPGIDKVEHATYFTLGGMCFLLGLRLAEMLRGKAAAIVITVLFCSFVGVLDEWHQLHVPGRSGGDEWDWLADTLGGFLGAHAAFWVQRRLLLSPPQQHCGEEHVCESEFEEDFPAESHQLVKAKAGKRPADDDEE